MATIFAPRTVDDYLRDLRRALQDAPPALVQDALGDAEDYLREEVALEPFTPESEVVARIARVFGQPHEVAAEYLAVEERMQMRRAPHAPVHKGATPARRGFFAIGTDWRAYGGLLYALLALPLGVFYFAWVATGISLSIGFAILIFGIPFTLLFILSVRMLALFEGRLIELMTGQRMPRRLRVEEPVRGLWPRIKAMLTDIRTWTAMTYMVLQLPFGIVYFVIAAFGIVLPVAFVAGPIAEVLTGKQLVRFGNGAFDRLMQEPLMMALMAVVGVLLFFAALHVLRFLARMHGRYAEAVLVKM
jgi:multidrug transporter EmrE-like cation transporter